MMMQKAKRAALCAAISLILGGVSVPLFGGYALAASVASQHKAYVESVAAGYEPLRPQGVRLGHQHHAYRKCLNTHIGNTYGSC